MYKRKILLSLFCIFIIFSLISIIYAFSDKIEQDTLNSTKLNNSNELYMCISDNMQKISTTEKQNVISSVEQYIPTLIPDNEIQTLSVSESISDNVNILHDNTINQDYYDIVSTNYSISLASDLSLRSFSDSTFNYDLSATASKDEARSFIIDFYNNLNVSHDYELAYLEIVDGNIWEADFAKKIDDIYNYYDSIKIFFSPEQEKIAALRVHSTKYSKPNTSVQSVKGTTISAEDAKNIVKNNFSNISDNDIIETQIVFTKPNNFFTKHNGTDIIYENVVVKAWKVTIKKDLKESFIFVDYSTGNVVGGDQIK